MIAGKFTPTVVAIPTRDRWDLLRPLLWDLTRHEYVDSIIVFDNSDDQIVPRDYLMGRVRVFDARGKSIYRMWNDAIFYCQVFKSRNDGDPYLMLLNDDVRIQDRIIENMRKIMDHHPEVGILGADYTTTMYDTVTDTLTYREVHGSYKDGGIGGWAFMLRTSLRVECDEQFEWWCGDDDLFRQVEEKGYKLGIADGCWVEHMHGGSQTERMYPELEHAKGRDVERMRAKWGSW